MLNYEQAKKLKDAGFPQNKSLWAISPTGNIHPALALENVYDLDHVDCPTLDELIKECNLDEMVIIKAGGEWSACSDRYGSTNLANADGSTPEEAVSNLWLELNAISTPKRTNRKKSE